MEFRHPARCLVVAVCIAAVLLTVAPAHGAATKSSIPLDRLFAPLFAQPRFHADIRIVADPLIRQRVPVWWIAPDRLRAGWINGNRTNLHVGKFGCILGRFWVCGRDTASARPEMRRIVLNNLFPQTPGSGSCCLHHLRAVSGPLPRTYTITGRGDPWLYPQGCLGCDLPGTRRPALTAEQYRAILRVDRSGRPVSMSSTVTIDAWTNGTRARVIHTQNVTFAYGGGWTIALPSGRHIPCPRWDRTPRGWCIQG